MKNVDMSEQLSLLVDDQLEPAAAGKLFGELERDPAAADQYSRYLLIGEVLRNRRPVLYDDQLAARIHQAIEREPSILVPDWRKRLRDQAVTLAMAATLAGLAVFVAGSMLEQRDAGTLATAAAERAAPDQLRDYLVSHNETAYLAANGGLMPYLRVVSSDRANR